VIACDEARVTDAMCLLRAGVQRSSSEPRAVIRPFAQLALARVLSAVGDIERADAVAAMAANDLEANSDVAWAPGLSAVRARNHLAAGHLHDAETSARMAIDASDVDPLHCFEQSARATLATVALLRGDVDAAECTLSDRAPTTVKDGSVDDAITSWVRGRICEVHDDLPAALDAVGPLFDGARAVRRLFVEEAGCAPWLVRLALSAGDQRRAAGVVDSMEIIASCNPGVPSVKAAATHAQGLLLVDVSLLVDAASAHVHPWNQASAAEDAGAALVGRGAHAAARQLFDQALETYMRIGAQRDAARIRTRLGASCRRRRTRRAGDPNVGWESLTDTEGRVVELVATGLTNREVGGQMFLSRHTVDFHLRQAFRKLNVQSRVQLTRLVLERSIAAG
jgi:ATP/maltotriose-dependent transcriptional regulator MalT